MTDKDTAAPAAADAPENKQNTKPRIHLTMGAVVLIAFFVLLALATVNYIRNNNSGSRAGVPSVTETTAVGQTAAATKAAARTTAKDKAGDEADDETENAVRPTSARPSPPTERRTEEPSGEASETETPTEPEESSEPPAETTLTEPEGETAESGE